MYQKHRNVCIPGSKIVQQMYMCSEYQTLEEKSCKIKNFVSQNLLNQEREWFNSNFAKFVHYCVLLILCIIRYIVRNHGKVNKKLYTWPAIFQKHRYIWIQFGQTLIRIQVQLTNFQHQLHSLCIHNRWDVALSKIFCYFYNFVITHQVSDFNIFCLFLYVYCCYRIHLNFA